METMGGAGMTAGSAPAAGAAKTNYYVLHTFYLKNGTQRARLDDYLAKGFLPLMEKLTSGARICLEGLVAAHMPQMAVICGYRSKDEIWDVTEKLWKDPAFVKAFEAWEKGDEPPYEHFSSSILQATDYSPEVQPLSPPPKTPRVFELRVYHAPTRWQLLKLHERFAGPEIRIFHRVGVHPILYTSTIFGQNMPNLTYLIPFDDLAARDKAWTAFGADPEWIKVRKESIDRSGQISLWSQMSLYRGTPYSPVR